ncbi:MAG: hypothetical protein O9972_64900, partial [Burkholderiales bacterium]|nr:hypothetical protein [Burkholderiales bacterium]
MLAQRRPSAVPGPARAERRTSATGRGRARGGYHRVSAADGHEETRMKASRSETVPIRGVDHHVRRWGPGHAPPLVLLHGSQDVSASWQFVVDALERDWHVVAPDWRGHGLSGR